jgi:hypothetical protein
MQQQHTLNILSFNIQTKGNNMVPELLHAMAVLKIHILGLQDTGNIFKTNQANVWGL